MSKQNSENNPPERIPNKLPYEDAKDIQARAQRLFDKYGWYPKSQEVMRAEGKMSDDEIKIVSEFIYFWEPWLVEKPKESKAGGPGGYPA